MAFPYDDQGRLNTEQAILGGVAGVSGGSGVLRTSSINAGGTISLGGDASDNRVSAFQTDATNLMMSAKSGDAGLLRISSIGASGGDGAIQDGADSSIEATVLSSKTVDNSGLATSAVKQLVVRQVTEDSNDNLVSAKSDDGGQLRVSAIQDGAASLNVSAKSGDAGTFHVSAIGGISISGTTDVEQPDADALRISAFSDDGATFRVSSVQEDATNLDVSAKSQDAGTFHVSAIGTVAVSGTVDVDQPNADSLRVSTFSDDGGTFRVSALPGSIDTYSQQKFSIGTTDTAVVSGIASQTIKVYAIHMTYNTAGGTKWTGAGTDLTDQLILAASAGYTNAVNPPAFLVQTTSAGTDLELALSGTISASGWVSYWAN
jgi:hypothetical protein